MELRDWQKEAYNELQKHNFSGVVKVASGKGKTVLAIHILKEVLKEGQALVVVPTIALMFQWQKEIEKFAPELSTSLYYGQKKDRTGKVILSVINSASETTWENLTIKILDEVHRYGSELYTAIFSAPSKHTIGLSATPEREDEGDFAIRYGVGKIVYSLDHIDELLTRFSLWTVRVPLTPNEYQRYTDLQSEYYKILAMTGMETSSIQLLGRKGNKFALRILKIWSDMARIRHLAEYKLPVLRAITHTEKENKIIIFSESIEFSDKLGVELDAIVVHSKMTKKQVIDRLRKFRQLKQGILVAPRMIDEGYDVPDANVAIVASFTRSARQMIQRDGRILRKKDYVRRYTLVLDGIEEDKFFSIIQKTNMTPIAMRGMWIRWSDGFVDDDEMKERLVEYAEHSDDYEKWVETRLELYKKTEQMDTTFYERHKKTIEKLVAKQPKQFSIMAKQKKVTKKIIKHDMPLSKQTELKKKLRQVNQKLLLPDEIFNSLMRYIDEEKHHYSKEFKEYILEVTKDDQAGIWGDELFKILQKLRDSL